MGHSLHNKIYLGRRHALTSFVGTKAAAYIATVTGAILMEMFWALHFG